MAESSYKKVTERFTWERVARTHLDSFSYFQGAKMISFLKENMQFTIITLIWVTAGIAFDKSAMVTGSSGYFSFQEQRILHRNHHDTGTD
ncbi:MAG UNVERIFIED_CONTAM: hypothetical protein LVR18_19145 [Planctomycetaceae bacterium]|jgi:hypothetical protein